MRQCEKRGVDCKWKASDRPQALSYFCPLFFVNPIFYLFLIEHKLRGKFSWPLCIFLIIDLNLTYLPRRELLIYSYLKLWI